MAVLQSLMRVINKVSRIINTASMVVFFLIMTLAVLGVILRLLGKPISGLTSLLELLLVAAIYFGIAYTQQRKGHISVELFLQRMKKKSQRIVNVIGLSVTVLFLGIVLVAIWKSAVASFMVREAMDGAPFFPIYPARIAMAIGVSSFWLQMLSDISAEYVAWKE
jgi:TRAP-type C4-dicarboxylate transport system permease small subunit